MSFDLAEATAILRRTPAVLDALLRGVPDAWVRADEGPESFSPFDVVGHLIDGEERDWMARARRILSRSAEPFEPFDRHRHRVRNAGKRIEILLDELASLRAANLDQLAQLRIGDAELALTGVHPSFGSVTLRQLLSTWVAHDLGHLAQVSRVMAKRYREDVGPWSAFLPVLTDRDAGPRSG
ncbi:MAG: DinB family protein [Gemmatimonadales bacterium]